MQRNAGIAFDFYIRKDADSRARLLRCQHLYSDKKWERQDDRKRVMLIIVKSMEKYRSHF